MASTATSPRRLPSEPPEPDISHLTEEEQQIILSVVKRSKAEEKKDEHIINNLEQDVKRLEANIKRVQKTVSDSVGLLSPTTDPNTCRICNKVKFAGSAGYVCGYCQLKSCSRCGGKIYGKFRTFWACNLCRKKQEISAKTGAWYTGPKSVGNISKKGSLSRQTSFTSDNEVIGQQRRSRDMLPGRAAKRSSSAHALMAIDKMDENANHSRFRTRIPSGDALDRKNNGDIGQPMRLRGEMETMTPFIIPKPASTSTNKQSPLKAANRPTNSGPSLLTMQRDDLAPSPTNRTPSQSSSLSSSRTLTTGFDSFDSRTIKATTSPPADLVRTGGINTRVSPHSDKIPAGSDSTMRERASSTSSRFSDSSRRSHDQAHAHGPAAYMTDERGIYKQSELEYRINPRFPARNQNLRQEESNTSHAAERSPVTSHVAERSPVTSHVAEMSPVTSHVAEMSPVARPLRQSQRPDPAPRRGIPEPAARQFKAAPPVDYKERHVEPQIPARRTNSGGSSGRQHPQSPQRQPADRLNMSTPYMHPDRDSGQYVDDIRSHDHRQPIESEHRQIDSRPANGSQRREVLANSREQNSSQDSNSTNLSNKLTVPGQHGDADHMKSARSRREMAMLHADSLSSDPSDASRPPPPKPYKSRKGADGARQLCSSDEEIRSTCTTSVGDDVESESIISEQAPGSNRFYDADLPTEEHTIAATVKRFLANPDEWSMSEDGQYVIGHMILEKKPPNKPLGLRVLGGQPIPSENNRLGAFITAVARDSIADTFGHLLPGDEVTEWNARTLQGATAERVSEIIHESGQESKVELFIRRRYKPDALPPCLHIQGRDHVSNRRFDAPPPSLTLTSAESPGMTRRLMSITHVTGKLQMQLWYNVQQQELLVTILSASELPLVEGNQPPQSFCKVQLLPDSNEATTRTTKTVGRTREPEWRQSFTYQSITRAELVDRNLDVSVWSLKRNCPSEFLGEIAIDLSTTKMNNEALWYRLHHHDESRTYKQKVRGPSSWGSGSVSGQSHMSRRTASDTGSEVSELDIGEDESYHRGRYDQQREGSRLPNHYHNAPQPRRPVPSQNLHPGRDDYHGMPNGPSPLPRRRQLPQVPQGAPNSHPPMTMSDRVPPHMLERHGRDNRHYLGRETNGRYSTERNRSYSDSRVGLSDDDMLLSDASEISEFSTRSAQSERPKHSKHFSKFMHKMESRGPAGRRQALSHSIGASPLIYSTGGGGGSEPGSVSDSGLAPDNADHRMNRKGSNYLPHNPQPSHAYGGYGRVGELQDRRFQKLNKQTSKDSTDGSVCSISSDSSNAKRVFAHLSERIEGLKREAHMSPVTVNNGDAHGSSTRRDSNSSNMNEHFDSDTSYTSDFRRSSDISSTSDLRRGSNISSISDVRRVSDVSSYDIRRDSDPGPHNIRRGSINSVASSRYEDDLALAQMTERRAMYSPEQHHHRPPPHYNIDPTTDINYIGNRLNELAARRVSDPRRLQVNEMVAAISNPDLFASQSEKSKPTPFRTPNPQGTSFAHSNHLSPRNSLGIPGQPVPPHSQQVVPQFPYTNGGTNLSHLSGAERLIALTPQAKNATQWAQPRNGNEGLNDFIEGLGPGQIVGRQVLGDSCLGELLMGLSDKKGRLEVEIVKLRNLVNKTGAKSLPAIYVKAYLMDGKRCVEKLKTPVTRERTLEPSYNCIVIFMEPYMQRILQVMVWGDYGKLDRKVFLGVAQVNLDDLDLSKIVFGTYKLFTTSSIVGSAAKHSSQSSLDSSYNPAR